MKKQFRPGQYAACLQKCLITGTILSPAKHKINGCGKFLKQFMLFIHFIQNMLCRLSGQLQPQYELLLSFAERRKHHLFPFRCMQSDIIHRHFIQKGFLRNTAHLKRHPLLFSIRQINIQNLHNLVTIRKTICSHNSIAPLFQFQTTLPLFSRLIRFRCLSPSLFLCHFGLCLLFRFQL